MKNLFKTKREAVEFLNSIDWLYSHSDDKKWSTNLTYHLAHGEYSSPDYMPRRYKTGWAISVDRFYYGGTYNTTPSGRIDDDYFTEIFL